MKQKKTINKSGNKVRSIGGVKISACGKLILCGEHAVMYGCPAIAFGVNQRLHVDIQIVENGQKVEIVSKKFGSFFLKADAGFPSWANQIVFLLKNFISTDDNANIIQTGIKITIDSNIDDYGIGSSGAIFACIACGLELLKIVSNNKNDLYRNAIYRKKYRALLLQQENNKNNPEMKKIEVKIKKMLFRKTIKLYNKFYRNKNYCQSCYAPSGIDLATSIFGGVVLFQKRKTLAGFTYKVKQLPLLLFQKLSIKAIFCGHKAITADAIKTANSVKKCKQIYKKIGRIVNKCATLIALCNTQNSSNGKKKNSNIFMQQLLMKLNENEILLEKLNLADKDVNKVLNQCKKQHIVAKISGSGLGDCVLALIDKDSTDQSIKIDNYKTVDIDIDEQGLSYEFYSPRSRK